MPQLFYGHVSNNNVRINYYRTGGHKPPVILLHGVTDNALCWNQVPMVLEVEYDMVMLDARGHGSSGLDAQGASPEVQASDVAVVIEALQLHKPILVGHSMGALAAALVAARRPRLIRAVVLEDPPWRELGGGNGGGRNPKEIEDWRASLARMKEQPLDEIIASVRRNNPHWDESEFFQWAKAKQQVKLAALDWLEQPWQPWQEIVRQISCPGLLITGDSQLGAAITPEVARQVQKLWRKVRVVHIPGAGHNIHREQFPAYMRELARFLKHPGR